MAVKLDSWKDIQKVDSAEKRHREDSKVANERATLDKKLSNAFRNYQAKKGVDHPKRKETISHDKIAKEIAAPKDLQLKTPVGMEKTKPVVVQTVVESHKEIKKPVDPQLNIYRSSSSTTEAAKNPLQTHTSQFVTAPKQPQLADLLLKRSNTPQAPKIKEGEQAKAEKKAEVAPEAKEVLTSDKIKAPIGSDAGAKLASTAKRDGETPTSEKKKGKKTEGGEGAKSKGALAAREAEASEGEGRLEATSSGVTGGSDEPVWIADLEPIGYTVNPSDNMDQTREYVRERFDKFHKYVAKPKEVAVLLERAQELDRNLDDLFDQVKTNIPPRNSYGVVRG